MRIGLLIAAALAVMAGAGCAHNRDSMQTDQSYSDTTNAKYLTGSYVPQDVQRNGPVTNDKSNVRVIDQSEIDRSGGADVRQSLRELGVTR